MIEDLTDKNINAYMIMSYDNPQVSDLEEFEDDVKIPKYIKRLINRYSGVGELKERLILNHIILFYNVFKFEAATRILFFKMDVEDYSILKTFLTYLNYMPEVVEMVNGKNIVNSDIPVCQEVVERLREL
tara:strand:+ start:920 stop:1309 length:390 start_codon:yes stop_codon:yes gene_type:complete